MAALLPCVNTEISWSQIQYAGVMFQGMKIPPPNGDSKASVAWLIIIAVVVSAQALDMKFKMLSTVSAVCEVRSKGND